MFHPSKLRRVGLIAIFVIAAAFTFILGSWLFMMIRINSARSIGVFPTPAEGMLTQVRSGWIGIQEAKIVQAVPETAPGGGAHVWFVVACVWAESKADGSAVGSPTHDFDAPASYFVDTYEGWVLMPGVSTPFVGFWMKVFRLAGDDLAEVIYGPSINSTPMCVRQAG